jgi:hypothetical protein
MLKNKLGQITIFMILGIILLFSTALIFYIKEKVTIPEEETMPALADIPEFAVPVREFVQSCAEEKLEEGIRIAMEHGGIIYTDKLYIDRTQPTEGEGVEYFPNSNYKIPYWAYMASGNDCSSGCAMATKMPPLCKRERIACITAGDNSVEEELQKYLKNEISKCTAGFEVFRLQGYDIEELSNMSAEVTVTAQNAIAYMEYDLKVKKSGAETDIHEYSAAIPTQLSKLYAAAFELANKTFNNCYYERYTQEQIETYSGLDDDLPPTSEDSFFENKRTWRKSEVEKKLRIIMVNMIALVRYNNSQNMYIPALGYSGEYKMTKESVLLRTINYDIASEQNAEIYTKYMPWWNSYLRIDPSEGEIIGPSNELGFSAGSDKDINFFEKLFKLLKHKEYYLSYQYSYPIITEIISQRVETDPSTKEVFRFAQEVNLRFGSCITPSTQIFSSALSSKQTMLCDLDMRDKANTTIYIFDEFNQSKPLEGAEVYFYAGDRCELGTTDSEGKIVVNMPKAVGYFLSFEKDNYLKKYIHEKDIIKPVYVYLKPIVQKKIVIKTINESILEKIKTAATTREASEWVENSSEDIKDFDRFTVRLERVQNSYMEPEFSSDSYYDSTGFNPDTVDLTTGDFIVDINLIDMRNHTIPWEFDRVCEEAGFGGDCIKTPRDPNCTLRGKSEEDFKNGDCYKLGYTCESVKDAIEKNSDAVGSKYWQCVRGKAILSEAIECNFKKCKDEEGIDKDIIYNMTVISDMISGGILLDNTSVYYRISDPESLLNSENITFYVFRQDPPTRHYHLENLMQYAEWSAQYGRYLAPRLG